MSEPRSIFMKEGWYCAGFSSEIVDEPLGRTFLDQPVVMYRAQDGEVVALSDICPHRFAPLHQGKLKDDVISCPYHGLSFNREGRCVHNPHGSGKIPPRSKIQAFSVAERDGFVWIWMGDPERADFDKVPNLNLIGDENDPRVTGYMLTPADYRLIIDNLLDLNHAPYLHGGTLSPIGTTRETWAERDDASAASHYLMRSVPTSTSQRLWFDEPVGDYHVSMHWSVPGTLQQTIAMTGEGRPKEEGALTLGAHLLTPQDATSTHYFWIMTRNRRVGDKTGDDALKAIIDNAFRTEDGPMLQACQANMNGREFEALRPIFLETDTAAGHARGVVRKILEQQSPSAKRPARKRAKAST